MGQTHALGANPIDTLTDTTGIWTLRFVLSSLAVTPLRRLTGWNVADPLRRMLGLFAFFYACAALHDLDRARSGRAVAVHPARGRPRPGGDVELILRDIAKRPYITVGFTGFVLMIPLALTSTAGWIRRLGGRWWQPPPPPRLRDRRSAASSTSCGWSRWSKPSRSPTPSSSPRCSDSASGGRSPSVSPPPPSPPAAPPAPQAESATLVGSDCRRGRQLLRYGVQFRRGRSDSRRRYEVRPPEVPIEEPVLHDAEPAAVPLLACRPRVAVARPGSPPRSCSRPSGRPCGRRRRRPCPTAPTATSSRWPAASSTAASSACGRSRATNNRIYTVDAHRRARGPDRRRRVGRSRCASSAGGSASTRCSWPATPGYVVGQEVLLLLERGPRGLRNVALSFSAFHVVPEGRTGAEAGVVRFAAGLDVVGERAESRRTRTLAEMRTIVGAIKGVQPVRPAGGAGRRPAAVRVEEPFTLLGSGSRWRQADTGTTVNWYRNTDRPHPLTSGNIDTEITTAARRVDQPDDGQPDPRQRRHAQRRRHRPTCSARRSTPAPASSRFEDPEEDAGSRRPRRSAAAARAGRRRRSTARTSRASRHGYVVFNQAASLGASYRVAPSFTRVLTHEIGHGIGLGHPCGGSGPTCTARCRRT